MSVFEVFKQCVTAIRAGDLIIREGRNDKEFHFQNWMKRQLDALRLAYDEPGRNTYPDFRLVRSPIGFEIKGLAYPGRDASYDCNSQVPRGVHHERTVYYVFGRYPKKPDGDRYPVTDLVICHGDFLNANSSYVHKNKSFKGFGSYGDILVRDRKMYVAPTPYALAEGTAHHRTLIIPADQKPGKDFALVGDLTRREVDKIVVAYSFDLKGNILVTKEEPNPSAGREHAFKAYRLIVDPEHKVTLRNKDKVLADLQKAVTKMDDEDED